MSSTSFDPRIVLRPRTLDETLDLALAYLRGSLREFARLFGLLAGVSGAILIGISIALDLAWPQRCLVAIVLSPLIERAVTVFSGRHIFQNEPRIGPSVAAALKRLPLFVLLSVAAAIPFAPMLITRFEEPSWIGLGAILGCFWPFVLASHVHLGEIALLEQIPLSRAAQRARVLVTYRFARAIGLVIFGGLIRLLVAASVQLTTEFVLGFVLQFGDVSDAIGGWPALIGYLLAGPYIAVVRMFDYVDARTRREGWDIQVRFNAIAQKTKDAEARRLAA